MKFDLATLTLLAGAIPAASAHYVFSKLIVDGTATKDFEYIRRNSNGYQPTLAGNITQDYFRCNMGTFENAAATKIMTVKPGQKIGFQLAYGATMKHPGPLQVYMSKADGDVKSYDGSGDWFKVYQMGLCQDTSDGIKDTDWCTWDQSTITFTLAEDTPPGQYLIRPEHIGLHRGFSGNSEFYYTCAQVEVTGSGAGTPGPTVKFPGVYKPDDANIHFNIYYPTPTSYTLPGPAVWPGNGTAPVASSKPASSSAPVASSKSVASPPATTAVVKEVSSAAPASSSVPFELVSSAKPVASAPVKSSAAPIASAPAVSSAAPVRPSSVATPAPASTLSTRVRHPHHSRHTRTGGFAKPTGGRPTGVPASEKAAAGCTKGLN